MGAHVLTSEGEPGDMYYICGANYNLKCCQYMNDDFLNHGF